MSSLFLVMTLSRPQRQWMFRDTALWSIMAFCLSFWWPCDSWLIVTYSYFFIHLALNNENIPLPGFSTSLPSYSSMQLHFNFTYSMGGQNSDDFISSDCNVDNQFWDPVYRNCYNLTCGFLYQNIQGTCQYRNITLNKLEKNLERVEQTIEHDNCTLVKLKSHEVT